MPAVETYKYFGLLAFVLLAIGLAFIVYYWPLGRHRTFSQHIAANRTAIQYYIVMFTIILLLLDLFFMYWFVPFFHISYWFTVFIVIASIAQYSCTLIPEVGGWKSTYHRYLAAFSGVCLMPPIVILLFTDSLTVQDGVFAFIGIVVMLSVLSHVIRNKKDQYEPSYVHQSLYYVGFFLPILVVSYL